MLQNVSIHAPTRGATTHADADYSQLWFQFTHPRGVRLRVVLQEVIATGFNSRTHAGATSIIFSVYLHRYVSIHAPTRGATSISPVSGLAPNVSIHAPTRGATDTRQDAVRGMMVSIHAPTRGATHLFELESVAVRFQFTHPRGVRPMRDGNIIHIGGMFQFTHPRGVRLNTARSIGRRRRCFNSRTHAGCDLHLFELESVAVRFQFTHPRGVRRLRSSAVI